MEDRRDDHNTEEREREAIQEIAEELDAQIGEPPVDGALHVDDYVIPQGDGEKRAAPLPEEETFEEHPPEELDPFAVLDVGLPEIDESREAEDEEILRTELNREDG